MELNRKPSFSSVALIFVVLVGWVSLFFLLFSLQKELSEQRRVSRGDSVWIASQVEREARVFLHSLDLHYSGLQGVSYADVKRRFDILWSRIESMDKGTQGEIYLQVEGASSALESARKMLRDVDELMLELHQGGKQRRDAIFSHLEPVVEKFLIVSNNASHNYLMNQEKRRLSFEKTNRLAIAMVCGIFLSGAILVFILLKNQRILDQLTHDLEGKIRDRALALEESNQRLIMMSMAIEQSPVSVIICDPEGNIDYVNPKFEEVTGYRFDEAVGKNPRFIQSGLTPEKTYRDMWQSVHADRIWQGEICNKRKNGELFWEHVSFSPIKDSNDIINGYLAVKEDISQQKLYEEQLLKQANYDGLTGLPNRMLAMDRLDQAILKTQRSGGSVALLFIDLDNFKQVNDSLGHECGDMLLQKAAQRFLDCLRDCDTAARLGGDEFIIILSELQGVEDVRPILYRIVTSFARPFNLRGVEVSATASIGVSLCPEDSTVAKELLKRSDSAMYDAKNAGKNNFCFYGQQNNDVLQNN